ncbi:hypothetical protein Ahu01nite_023170 [Winogradskya humida]|uniref:RseC/MucC-like positive regulator of sigma(E) n=1 Tax=Winogradskya humida TaxID=113566 RepID=A0ABQ3ZKU8_9ACTN|nr:hypothetical protein Ahu01nite_023170 [Actinoplanes humidus]
MPPAGAIDVSAAWLATNPVLPDRCVKHGLPVQRRVSFVVKSRPKVSPVRKLFVPGYTALNRGEEYLSKVQFVRVQGWPLCAECVRRRRLGITFAAVLLFGGLAAIVVAVIARSAMSGNSGVLGVLVAVGFVAMLVSPVPFSWAGLPRLTQTQATADGDAVHVDHASPEFVRQIEDGSQGG